MIYIDFVFKNCEVLLVILFLFDIYLLVFNVSDGVNSVMNRYNVCVIMSKS